MPYGREDEYTGQEAQDWEILSQNMPNASDKEKSEMFQRYKKEKHFAEREWEGFSEEQERGGFNIYDFLEGMGIDTNQNLPPDVQGRMQEGRQAGQPSHFLKRGSEPQPSPQELEAVGPRHFLKRGNEPQPTRRLERKNTVHLDMPLKGY